MKNSNLLSSSPGSSPSIFRLIALGVLVLLSAGLLSYHWQLISFPYLLESREAAQPWICSALAKGVNSFAVESYPQLANVYGWTYYALLAFLERWSGLGGLGFHRSLVALFIAASLLLEGMVLQRLGSHWIDSWALLLSSYACMLLGVGAIARPDALGLLLCVAGLSLPFLADYGLLSLALAAICFSLAWATKIYFLFFPFVLLLWLFLKGPRRQALAFSFFFLGVSALLMALLLQYFPTYLYQITSNVFLGNHLEQNPPPWSWMHLVSQLKVLFLEAYPAAFLLPFLSFPGLSRSPKISKGHEWTLYTLLGLLVFVLILGRNRGAWLTYGVQLIIWPLGLSLGAQRVSLGSKGQMLSLAFLINAVLSSSVALGPDLYAPAILDSWAQAKFWVENSARPIGPSDLGGLFLQKGAPLYDAGFGRDLVESMAIPSSLRACFPLAEKLNAQAQAYRDALRRGIAEEDFDLVVLSENWYLMPVPIGRDYHLVSGGLLHYPLTQGVTKLLYFRKLGSATPASTRSLSSQAKPGPNSKLSKEQNPR